MKKTEDQLRDYISLNDSLAEYGAMAIVVGLVIEIFLAVVFRSGKTFIENWAPVIADGLIALGVYSEIHFGRKSTASRKELQDRSDEKVAELNERAAEADRKAKEAELALIEFRKPRGITPDQRTSIAEKLKSFAGTQFDTGLSGGSGEQADLLWQLAPAITDAGWSHMPWTFVFQGQQGVTQGTSRPISGAVAASNVEIHLHPETQDRLMPATKALISALKEIGIDVKFCGFNTYNNNPNAIHILIGEKR